MLELHDAAGAFAAVEDYLASQGFFTDRESSLRASLYLGYGLSAALRRGQSPPPPEPCPLPLVACQVGHVEDSSETDPAAAQGATAHIGAWETTWQASDYEAAIDAARAAIARGDVYQVNLVQHLSAAYDGDPVATARALRPVTPGSPPSLIGDGWAIISASPELLLRRRGDRVFTMPIKGTRPVVAAGALASSAKDAAEHVMIVDLERNDLSRVCLPGSVRLPVLLREQELAGVRHLVSCVEGRLRPGVGLAELLAATFPGGSVTGAPKIAAIDHIAELEPVGRGASMGGLGTVWPNGDLDLALTIRTFAVAAGRIHLWVGGGIVWDSQPAAEVEESWVKARPLLTAIAARTPELAAR